MKHRLLTRWIAALGILAAPLALAVAPPANAGLSQPGIVDLTVSVKSLPDIVAAQPGAGTIYRITVTNGPLSLGGGAQVTGTLPESFEFIDGDAGCSAVGDDVTCDIAAIAPGTSQSVDFRAAVGTSLGEFPFTVAVTSKDVTEDLEHTDNNTATTTTTVVSADEQGGHPAYVCGGCSLTFSHADIGSAELFVPEGSNGVIVRLSLDNTTLDTKGNTCGTIDGQVATCDAALKVWFDEDEDKYQVDDETNPIAVHFTPTQGACHGVGRGGCAPIGYYDPSPLKDLPGPEGDPERMPECDGAGSGDSPGLGHAYVDGSYHVCKDWSYKDGKKVRHVVLMKSIDPLIPPLNLGR